MAAMKIIISGMTSWHMEHTALGLQRLGFLSQFWSSNKSTLVDPSYYKRIWPYHLAKKPFYYLSGSNLEEKTRWQCLPFYDWWVSRQSIPDDVTVVHGAMGSCTPLFDLAERKSPRILKVYEAMNGHPTTQRGYWQREVDLYSPKYKIPIPDWVWSRMNREIRRADLILCPSEYVRDSMIANGERPGKCIINPFGVDTSIFKERQKLPDKPTFVFAGSQTVRKGSQYLLPAFKRLRERIPEAELYCCGSLRPDFKKEVKKWRNEDGIFIPLTLSQQEVAELLQRATAFVLPSLEEGFARAIVEALASGVPVIAT